MRLRVRDTGVRVTADADRNLQALPRDIAEHPVLAGAVTIRGDRLRALVLGTHHITVYAPPYSVLVLLANVEQSAVTVVVA
jgi:hypothetical protein